MSIIWEAGGDVGGQAAPLEELVGGHAAVGGGRREERCSAKLEEWRCSASDCPSISGVRLDLTTFWRSSRRRRVPVDCCWINKKLLIYLPIDFGWLSNITAGGLLPETARPSLLSVCNVAVPRYPHLR